MGLTRIQFDKNSGQCYPWPADSTTSPKVTRRQNRMRACVRYALVLFAATPTLLGAQGFGIYEQGTCAMGRAGAWVAAPCSDGSAMFFNSAGLSCRSGGHSTYWVPLFGVCVGFTVSR